MTVTSLQERREAFVAQAKARNQTAREQINTQLAGLATAAGWQQWLRLAAKFPHQPLRNQLLIAAQRPDATLVQSAKHWRQVGRWPAKGSTAIRLWAHPHGSWVLAPMFDLAQTAGSPLPNQPLPQPPPLGQAPRGMRTAVRDFAERHGLDADQLGGDEDASRSEVLAMAARAAQLATDPPPAADRELVTSSLQYLVAADYGLAENYPDPPTPPPGLSPAELINAAEAILTAGPRLLEHLRESGVGHPDRAAELREQYAEIAAPMVARASVR